MEAPHGDVDAPRALGQGAVVAEPDDAALVQAARGGDERAFDGIFRRYGRLVHGLLLARVPRAEADDLTQDVFLKAFGALHKLRDPHALGPWISTIARSRAADWYRRRPAALELPEPAAESSEPHPSEAEGVLNAIRGLPEAYRETLLLRLVEGLTGPEIAAHTGLTPGSVRVNLHRGMRLLRGRLGSPSVEPESEA